MGIKISLRMTLLKLKEERERKGGTIGGIGKGEEIKGKTKQKKRLKSLSTSNQAGNPERRQKIRPKKKEILSRENTQDRTGQDKIERKSSFRGKEKETGKLRNQK